MRSALATQLAVAFALAMAMLAQGTITPRMMKYYKREMKANGGLTVHVFDVGQAMSQMLVFPSGYTVFIDGPELKWNSDGEAKIVAEKLEVILQSRKTIDVAVVTHLHLDHLGYQGTGGLWALIEKHGFKFKKIIERDSGRWVDANHDGLCTPEELVFNNVGTLSSTGTRWLCYATDPLSKVYPVRETAKLCSTSQIAPPDPKARVTIVAVDAIGATMRDGSPVGGDHRKDLLPPSENDYSVGLLVQYGNFSFATFGDLDGEYATSDFGYVYDDVESTVSKRLGQVDVYNVNHHGSSHSSNTAFLKKLRPTISTVSCGGNNSYGHPAQETLDRLHAINSSIFLTENGNPQAQYYGAVVTNSDIVIAVSAATDTYEVVYENGSQLHSSKGTKHPVCRA